ncbi:hypothetical protein [Streptomyces sp. NPDC020141]|uniref:hypothetical protein n=1 Tax=Streptomyces sp. NPDC020141 TaxID=3365065 RepID=UPI003793FF20
MDTHEYLRTQKVLDELNSIEKRMEQTKDGRTFPREDVLEALRRLHLALEEMFWAGDFKKEGESE